MRSKKIGNILYNFLNGNFLNAEDGDVCLNMDYIEHYKVAYIVANALINGDAKIVFNDEDYTYEIKDLLMNIREKQG